MLETIIEEKFMEEENYVDYLLSLHIEIQKRL
jgi:hypothetical protein